jgi:hypothetical protein
VPAPARSREPAANLIAGKDEGARDRRTAAGRQDGSPGDAAQEVLAEEERLAFQAGLIRMLLHVLRGGVPAPIVLAHSAV